MFGRYDRITDHAAGATVLLDGRRSSFVLLERRVETLERTLEWGWSADLLHTLVVDEPDGRLRVGRWDAASWWPLPLPRGPLAAEEVLSRLALAGGLRAPDVVTYALRAFRMVREELQPHGMPPEMWIDAFNALLTVATAVQAYNLEPRQWRNARTLADLLQLVGGDVMEAWRIPPDSGALRHDLAGALEMLIYPDARTGYRLHPSLLLRHASGELYQEAHLLLQREHGQLFLPGMSPGDARPGHLPKAVRFTPVPLARFLVEQALAARRDLLARRRLRVLDPACGCGVFLQEALRALAARGYRGNVHLVGWDSSAVSCAMARFVLSCAARDTCPAGVRATVDVSQRDSLGAEWGQSDIVLMNPPFVSWKDQGAEEREAVRLALGPGLHGRADAATAFVRRAVEAVQDGVVASVVPARTLDGEGSRTWREWLQSGTRLHLVGSLRGYGYFPYSMVEAGFLVLSTDAGPTTDHTGVTVLSADADSADRAIRDLRRGHIAVRSRVEGLRLAHMAQSDLPAASWTLPVGSSSEVVAYLADTRTPAVDDLFDVLEGAKTGCIKAFTVPESEYVALPGRERSLLRPVAGGPTITDGRIARTLYLFYPYNDRGVRIGSEDQLSAYAPDLSKRLEPYREALRARARIDPSRWWLLTWERPWLHSVRPKLVTREFGLRGSFAYDASGETVVLNGFCWQWREGDCAFHETDLPWAYLALLNSALFEALLRLSCPPYRGGHVKLAKRHVRAVLLPDLSDDTTHRHGLVQELASVGRSIHELGLSDSPPYGKLVAQAYRLPLELLPEECRDA
jgi:predicted RNA methylase